MGEPPSSWVRISDPLMVYFLVDRRSHSVSLQVIKYLLPLRCSGMVLQCANVKVPQEREVELLRATFGTHPIVTDNIDRQFP